MSDTTSPPADEPDEKQPPAPGEAPFPDFFARWAGSSRRWDGEVPVFTSAGFLGPDLPPRKQNTDADKPAHQMYGMQPLKDMSRDDMIAELLYHYRHQVEVLDKTALIHNVVHCRLKSYSERLNAEVREASGGLGFLDSLGD